ncbi:TPA: hypothetical protein ACKROF_001114 [Pseudomonas aeruginosa]
MSSTQHQLIEQCATRLRGIVEALDNIHDTSPHRWSTDLDDVHSSAESLLAMIKGQAPTQAAQGLAGAALAQPSQSQYEASFEEWLANELEGEDGQPVPAAVCDIALARRAFNHWPKLEQPAKVGGVRFSAGVSSRLVVEAAQRLYEFESTPEKEAERIERLQAFREQLDPLNLAPHAEAFNEAPADALRPEQAEAERPEVVARVDGTDEDWFIQPEDETELHNEGLLFAGCELGRMIDFDRIVGALRAENAKLIEALDECDGDRWRLRSERDAALAEVERLRESKGDPVGSLEKCMKVMYERDENAKRLEAALARVAELEKELAMARDAAAKGDAARHAAGGMEMEIHELKTKLAELEKQEPVAWGAFHFGGKRDGKLYTQCETEAQIETYILDMHRSSDSLTLRKGPLYAAPVAQAQQLNDLDKQCRDDVARALGLRPNQERGFAWSYLLASIKSCVKASGDSAQAQHSVPDHAELLQALERTHAGHMVGHDQSDQPKGGYSDGYVNGFGECIKVARKVLAAAPSHSTPVPQAWIDVLAERRRQVEAEGWTPEHDDEHSHGQMARAAACYALAGSSAPNDGTAALLVSLAWPWDQQWWKPTSARRDLVKACALALAEIERLDRAAANQGGPRDA